MTIKLINDPAIWDTFVENSRYSSIFHKWNFLKTISKHTEYSFLPYGAFREKEIICVIPLFYKQIYSAKLLFSPPPLTCIPYLGLMFDNEYYDLKQNKREDYLKNIINNLHSEINKINPDYISMALMPCINDIRYFKWLNYEVEVNFTYILDLDMSLDDIFNKFKHETRRKIRKAQEMNLKINKVNDTTLIYDELKKRYDEQNLSIPIINSQYIKDIQKCYQNEVNMRTVELDEKIIGSEILLFYKDTAWDWLGSVRPAGNIAVNESLKWEAIKECKEKNIIKMDFVGANNINISLYKSQFNPDLISYYTIKKSSLKGKIAAFSYTHFIRQKLF